MSDGKKPSVKNTPVKTSSKTRVVKAPVAVVVSKTKEQKVPELKKPRVAKKSVLKEKDVVKKAKVSQKSKVPNQRNSTSDFLELVTTVPRSNVPVLTPAQLKKGEFSAILFSNVTERRAAKFTRVAGVAFAIVGILCTLLSLQSPFAHRNEAQLLHALEISSTTEGTLLPEVDCTDPLLYSSPTCKSVVDIKPPATFTVTSNDTTLQNSEAIRVTVAHATKVRFGVYAVSAKKLTGLGVMTNSGGDDWDFTWNTTKFPDGEYQLRAIIDNAHGSYEVSDTHSFVVENLKPVALPPPTETVESVETTADLPAESPAGPVLTQVSSTIAGEFRFEIKATGASSVKLYAKRNDSTAVFIGSAYKGLVPGSWKYRWQPSKIPAGTYDVAAYAFSGTESVVSNSVSITIPTAEDVAAASTTPVAVEAAVPKVLQPPVMFTLSKPLPLSGIVEVTLDVANASSVQMYARGNASLIKQYLGYAVSIDNDTWLLQYDSAQLPDGAYTVIAVVKNQFGSYEAVRNAVTIKNAIPVVLTPEQSANVKALAAVGAEVASTTIPAARVMPPVKIGTTSTSSLKINTASSSRLAEVKSALKSATDAELVRLAAAMRMNDNDQVAAIKSRIENLKVQTSGKLGVTLSADQSAEIDSLVAQSVAHTEERVKAVEKIITERTKEKANQDSDSDGVSNYDEVAIYKTNPYRADTDNDGFTDGAEILSGYDPLDAKTEVLVAYESPKETGIVRDDILTVTSISTAQPNEIATTTPTLSASTTPVALISGKAPVNSFVTLYIFSTPTVVTIKTDADGSWNYRFDKELEDGEHQVYIGVTDNAGKIIAKSNPFNFIKKAEAFTGTDTASGPAVAPVIVTDGEMLSDYSVYGVLAVSVVAIALLLLLLGLHLETAARNKPGVITSE